jgi:hypothetical protein
MQNSGKVEEEPGRRTALYSSDQWLDKDKRLMSKRLSMTTSGVFSVFHAHPADSFQAKKDSPLNSFLPRAYA